MLRTVALVACMLGGTARADESAPPASAVATYAIVVGSNAGGPGQADLRYAEDDAKRVGDVLAELGGYRRDQIDIVLHPTPDQLRDRLIKLGARVKADVAAGQQAQVFFYYSGHARAAAIDLGGDELPLEELRARLFEVPATLMVVVLDACQSGAFSHVKGARPAADFSFNSRQHLEATGIAVLASSSGTELSQESVKLRSSYFTYHLLVGLRGAGDANGDGQVSIDEAYRYAYHQTLLATAETAVGGQHVTFEADLKGHGEVPLSYPRAATASIELPAQLEGKTLVEDRRARAVVAETYKARGAAVRIAVAPGDYDVLVSSDGKQWRCEVAAPGIVELARCRTDKLVTDAIKGGGMRQTRIEVGVLAGNERDDAYTNNLRTFGYNEPLFAPSEGLSIVGLRALSNRIWIGGGVAVVSMPGWRQNVVGSGADQTFGWSTTTVTAIARGEQPLATSGILGHVAVFGQVGTGLGVGHTSLTNAEGNTNTDTYFGPAFSVAAGLHLHSTRLPWFGCTLGYQLDYAPVIKDLLGNTHASGGDRATIAFTYSY